jgi:hypothetical protein
VPCTVTASAGFDEVVASASFVMPAAGETLTVDLVVQGTPRTVRGRVQTRDGTPVEAAVELHNGSRSVETRARRTARSRSPESMATVGSR